jgi:hypothetical protein
MPRKVLIALASALMVGLFLVALAGQLGGGGSPMAPAFAGASRMHLGPFATLRRAWEEANAYRARGCRTSVPYHNGDGYYVDVTCND